MSVQVFNVIKEALKINVPGIEEVRKEIEDVRRHEESTEQMIAGLRCEVVDVKEQIDRTVNISLTISSSVTPSKY